MIPYSARLPLAVKAFVSILFSGRWPSEAASVAAAAREEKPPAQQPPSRVTATAMQILAVLQRDGRLIDFLMEDLKPYADAQVGAAARDVHTGCRRALQQYLTMVPVLAGMEGDRVTVEAGTEAGIVHVFGNVTGQPPFQGVLKHRGWAVDRIDLPVIPATTRAVVAPAEVEVS
jgi:hypothetical protein